MRYEELIIGGRGTVLEAFRSGRITDKLFVLDGCQGGPARTILREVRKYDTTINYMPKERLDQISETGKHQGVIAYVAIYEYAEVEDTLKATEEKGKPSFLILLDDIEDPHNLGTTIRTVNLTGAYDVIIPKRRTTGLTATAAKILTEALNYTPVAKVTNLMVTMEDLRKKDIWFVRAGMGGGLVYKVSLKGSIGLVVGNEGEGVGKLVREHCDMVASTPMKGNVDSLNTSVVTGMLAYEIAGQRLEMQSSQR